MHSAFGDCYGLPMPFGIAHALECRSTAMPAPKEISPELFDAIEEEFRHDEKIRTRA
jgi:hypothetical protein